MKTLNVKILLLLLAVCMSQVGWGQISIGSTSPAVENFNSMGTSGTAALPSNWKVSAPGAGLSATWTTAGNFTAVLQQASSGAPATGSRYNWGISASDRALGFMTSGGYASPNSIMAFYQNSTAGVLSDLVLSFDYKRFRINSAQVNITFFSSSDGTTWTAQTAGDDLNTTFTTGASAYNFATGTSVTKTLTLSGLNIPSSGSFYLKWSINTVGTNSQGIGLDNVSILGIASSCTPPSAPTVSASQTFPACSTPNVGNLTATGTAVLWYTTSTAGTALTTGTSLITGTTYYASQTVTCESTTRTASTVTIGACSLANLTISPAFNITTNSATIGADVTSSSSLVTDKGTYYDVNPSPLINGTSQGSGLGAYTRNLTGLTPNTLYYYTGYAVNSTGTATGTALTFTTLHNAPTGATGTPTYKSISASWVAPSGGGSAAFTYDVQISSTAGFSIITASTTGLPSTLTSTSFSSGLVQSTTYYIRVRATNASGSSAWSSTATATLLPSSGVLSSGLAMWVDIWSGTAVNPTTAPFIGNNVGLAQASSSGIINTSSSDRYNSNTWNNVANHLNITVNPSSGYALNLNGESLIASMGSSATGPSGYTVYSSVDNYASPLGTLITTCPSPNFITTRIVLPSTGYNGLTSINFKIYGVQSGCSSTLAVGGTGGFTALTVTGTAVPFACTTPSAPTGSATQTFAACSAPTIASLTANGTNIKWYASASTVGGALSSSLALTNGTSYYATQNTGCESTTFYQTTVSYASCSAAYDYSWIGGTSGSWTTATNWSPTRSTPNVLDKLTISGNVSISGVPTQTIDALYIANNANVTLSAGGTNTLTIGSTAGTDFVVGTNSILTLASPNVLTITLATGNKGSIYGTVTTTGAAHKLGASSSTDPITFYSGAIAGQGGGSMFNGISTMVFNAGSSFIITTGGNPFTSAVFDPAANFIHWTNNSPSLSGRTYPNLIIKSGVITSGSGGSPFSVQSLTVESGASFNISGFTGNISINGVSNILGNATVVWPNTAQVTNSNTLNLNPTGTLTIGIPNLVNNGVLNVYSNTLTVSSLFTNSGTINISDGGSLLQAGTGANSGTFNISRSATNVNDWSFYSSPVAAAPVSNLGNSIYYAFDETVAQSYTSGWVSAPSTLAVGKGYLAFPNRVTFTGVANNGTYNSVGVSLTGAFSTGTGWNLLGNPYPSSIRASSFLSANSAVIAGGTLYLWQNNQYLPYITAGSEQIGSGQAFFVQVQSSGSVTFNNTMRGTSNSTFFRTEADANPYVRVRLSSGADWQDAIVGFDANATDGYDVNYDGGLMNGNSNISFYSEVAGRKLTTQALEAPINGSKIVPLYYTSAKGGNFDIKLQNYYNPDPSLSVTLKDKTTGAETDLTTTTVVSAVLAKGSDINRFDLVFRQAAVTGSSDNAINGSLNVYTSNETLNVAFTNPSSSTADVYVFNTLGTEILKSNNVSTVGTKSFATSNLNKGVYIVKVGFANGKVENRKIVIE